MLEPDPVVRTPCVVLVDPGWYSLQQFGSALRRRGVPVSAVVWRGGVPSSRVDRLGWRLVHERPVVVDTAEQLSDLLARDGADRVVDVLCPEALAPTVADACERAGVASDVLARLRHRVALGDKMALSRALSEMGVAVPAQVHPTGEPLRAADVVARLGLPVVLKTRRGSGGQGVRVAHTLAEAEAALEALAVLGDVYAEEFLDGHRLSYGCAVGADGVVLDTVVVGETGASLGPSTTIRILDRPDLMEAGRRAAEALGAQGLLEIEVLEVPGHAPCAIDANPRPWGGLMAGLCAGLPFVDAYLHTVPELAPYAAPLTSRSTGSSELVHVFPRAGSLLLHTGEVARGLALLLRSGRALARHTGSRYVLGALVQVTGAWRENRRDPS